MQQLTGLDTSFLNMETGPVYGHVASLAIYDNSTADEPLTAERVAARWESRIHQVPVFRKKLVEVPMSLDHPYWVDDPDFDINAHVYNVAVPAPGTILETAEVVSRLAAKPLDRTRPLWEIAVINGLADGRTAVLTKVHHSMIDGKSGSDLMTTLLDLDPQF
jgi:diacylglycerol O-acyltransferase